MQLPDSYAEAGRRPAKSAVKHFYDGGLNVSFKAKSEEIDLNIKEKASDGYPEFQQTLEIKPVSGLSIFSQLTNWEDFIGTLKVASGRLPLVHELSYRLKTSHYTSSLQPPLYEICVKTAYRSESLVGECCLKFPSVWPRIYAATLLGHRGFFVGSKLSFNARQPFQYKYGLKIGYLTKQLELYGGYSSAYGLSFGIISSRGPFKCILFSEWSKSTDSMCSSVAVKYWITDECFLKASLNDCSVLGGSIGFKLSSGTFVSASILQAPESYSKFNTRFGLAFDFEK
uniref:Voltage-dependent anion-selective channel protein 1 n=1 Tax=Schistocephalus solidus TaxID=70667 RepID=A0A0X3PBN7_SCHSO